MTFLRGCIVQPLVSRRIAGMSLRRRSLHETQAVDELRRLLCYAHYPRLHVPHVRHGSEARRILSLESRFYRCWSVEVASIHSPESSRMNSGCTGSMIGIWS